MLLYPSGVVLDCSQSKIPTYLLPTDKCIVEIKSYSWSKPVPSGKERIWTSFQDTGVWLHQWDTNWKKTLSFWLALTHNFSSFFLSVLLMLPWLLLRKSHWGLRGSQTAVSKSFSTSQEKKWDTEGHFRTLNIMLSLNVIGYLGGVQRQFLLLKVFKYMENIKLIPLHNKLLIFIKFLFLSFKRHFCQKKPQNGPF